MTPVTILIAVLIALMLVDMWTTYRILGAGGRELNPIARKLMELWGVKPALIIMHAAGIAALLIFRDDIHPGVIAGAVALYVGVAINNISVMRKMGVSWR